MRDQGLISIHALEVLAGKIAQQRMDNLNHVAKGFEGDKQAFERIDRAPLDSLAFNEFAGDEFVNNT